MYCTRSSFQQILHNYGLPVGLGSFLTTKKCLESFPACSWNHLPKYWLEVLFSQVASFRPAGQWDEGGRESAKPPLEHTTCVALIRTHILHKNVAKKNATKEKDCWLQHLKWLGPKVTGPVKSWSLIFGDTRPKVQVGLGDQAALLTAFQTIIPVSFTRT